MSKPNVIVFAGYGLNSEEETLFAFEKAGAKGEIVHINDLIDGRKKLADYQIMAFPGGFAYGDDTGSGNAYANRVRNNLWEDVLKFANEDKLIIGICNGCQIIVNLGLIPGFKGELGQRKMALRHNIKARYECRFIDLKGVSRKSIFSRGIDRLHVPVSHGEGNFYATPAVLEKLKANDQIAFQFVKPNGELANGEFPYNPNGAVEDIAALCDETGRIFGIMPHPERNLFFTSSDDWTFQKELLKRQGKTLPEEGEGMKVFRNGVEYFRG